MTFVFPILLGSLVLITIPVLVHLIMRRKPKTLPFPAFRFLVQKRKTNLRRLRLRHLLLLALRILIIACIALALARPSAFLPGWDLGGDRPVAAVLLFDTSPSMEYRTSDTISRLDEAKKRGLELIEQLPAGSRVAMLDSANETPSGKTPWCQNISQAQERIKGLQLNPANAAVTRRLDGAYRILADLANSKDDVRAGQLPRLIFVFSNRTRASWKAGQTDRLREAGDRVPPSQAGLEKARAEVPSLIDLLGDLRKHPGIDFAEQAFIEELGQLKELLARIAPESGPHAAELTKRIDNVRRQGRALADLLAPEMEPADPKDKDKRPQVAEEVREYRAKLLTAVTDILHSLAGARALYIDVGIDHPVDVTVLDLMLPMSETGRPRQVFTENERVILRALVQATGKDVSTMLRLQVGKKTLEKALDIKAGQSEPVPFEVNCADLGVGEHSAELKVVSDDLLPGNNSRFVTFAVRRPRRVLVVTDKPSQAEYLVNDLEWRRFSPDIALTTADPLTAEKLLHYETVYLLGVAKPDAALWSSLAEYVGTGGSVGVIPGGEEMARDAYNQEAAQKILPGTFQAIVTREDKPVAWDLESDTIFQHPLLRPFLDWKKRKTDPVDFLVLPRTATKYWDVRPHASEMVLVSYADDKKRPALLERTSFPQAHATGSRALMFTTTFDPRVPPWNNYLESDTSFYRVLVGLCTNYLAGDLEAVQLNFLSGQDDPVVPLPLSPRFPVYQLSGSNVFEQVRVPKDADSLVLKQASAPGNYTLSCLPPNDGKFTARFSVNLPREESDLTRVPIAEIEAVLGPGSVLTGPQQANLKGVMQGEWREPVDLYPSLMLLLLLVLAVENLLANRFYAKEND